jgi:hypothetical protein
LGGARGRLGGYARDRQPRSFVSAGSGDRSGGMGGVARRETLGAAVHAAAARREAGAVDAERGGAVARDGCGRGGTRGAARVVLGKARHVRVAEPVLRGVRAGASGPVVGVCGVSPGGGRGGGGGGSAAGVREMSPHSQGFSVQDPAFGEVMALAGI